MSTWEMLDYLAHFLYTPTLAARRCGRTRWHHRIHLIPGSVLGWVCQRYEHRLTGARS